MVADNRFLVEDTYQQVTLPWRIDQNLIARTPFTTWSLDIPQHVKLTDQTKLAVQFEAKRIEIS